MSEDQKRYDIPISEPEKSQWDTFVTRLAELARETLGDDANLFVAGQWGRLGHADDAPDFEFSTSMLPCTLHKVLTQEGGLVDAVESWHNEFHEYVIAQQASAASLREKVEAQMRENGIENGVIEPVANPSPELRERVLAQLREQVGDSIDLSRYELEIYSMADASDLTSAETIPDEWLTPPADDEAQERGSE